MSKDYERLARAYRRKFADLSTNISQIKDWGKKACSDYTDKETAAFFRGMLQHLEANWNKYEELWSEFEGLQDEGAEGIPSPTDIEGRKLTRNCYYMASKYSQLLTMNLEEANRTRDTTVLGAAAGLNESKIARSLPKIHLPTFDGTQSAWPGYRDTFVSLVDSDVLMAGVSKLHYLRASLSGPALALISHLAITDANYAIAWNVIQEAYNNKRLLASTYLDTILAARPMTGKATPESLKMFLSNVADSVSGLKLLEIENQDDYILFYLAARALDPSTRELFEMENKGVTFPSVDSLIKFVRERATSLLLASTGTVVTATSQPQKTQGNSQQKPPQPKTPSKTTLLTQGQKDSQKKKTSDSSKQQQASTPGPAHTTSSSKHPPCHICKTVNHHLLSCEKFHLASAEEKWKLITGWDGCINCLNPNHPVQKCTSTWKCRFCPERHHSSLHRSKSSLSAHPIPGTSQSNHSIAEEGGQIILGTAVVEFLDARGAFQAVRTVIDSGSQDSFITQKCLNRLGLTMQSFHKRISGIGQTPFEGTKGKTTCILRPINCQSLQLKANAVVVSNITSYLPSRPLSPDFINRCSSFELADPGFWKPAAVEFLIGADLFAQVMTGRVIPIEGSQAGLFSSIFGYIVLGKVDNLQEETAPSLFTMTAEDDLNHQLKRFWELEEPATSTTFKNPADECCEDHFRKTHTRQADGKYVIRLPFKEHPPSVGDSTYVARKRFLNLEKKLESNDKLKEGYHEIIREYLHLDHMTPASQPTQFVIPHHCISKHENDTVKLRVVFDASVPVPNGSLNEHLLTGEKLQRDIRDVVLSFRQHKVVFSSDIVKMFRMIVVNELDRGFLQIFWRFKKEENLQLLELKTLPFGLASSPYIALRVLKQLCLDHGSSYPLAAQVLQKNIYVDDILAGANDEEQALELKQQLENLLIKGGFQLSKWVTNSKQILQSVDKSATKTIVSLSDKEDTWVKLLGLQWDPYEDAFRFSFQTPTPVYSKRGILSAVARLYDPLGFLSPVTVTMKGIVQDLWKLGVHWDNPVPENIKNLWDTILNELPHLATLRIPRFIHTRTGTMQCQVVGFADASIKAYAAVIYLRVLEPSYGWRVSFLTSKTKLAPTKSISIPRLELCGVVLLMQLYSSTQDLFDSMTATFKPPVFFTDSSIVLSWLSTPNYKLQTFVANRVAKVQEFNLGSWRHINSEENPSDVASRGTLPSQLPNDELWWKGPSWLTLDEDEWPTPSFNIDPNIPEIKTAFKTTLVTSHNDNSLILWMERFSALLKVTRVVAWMQRWVHNAKSVGCSPRRTGPLSLAESAAALETCIKWTQKHHLFQGRTFSFVVENFAKLQPFLDQNGIVRVGGRLQNSNLSDAQKFPILMPADAHLTVLIVDHYHKSYLHPGPNLLQAIIQKIYWVPSLRRLIRLRGFKCNTCYRLKAKASTPLMGDLPSYRVNGGRAFLHIGVDFAGPFQMRESLRRKAAVGKVYLCLFVCMATKALHLEAVTQLSTKAFLAALERFTSRRGIPSDIYSDRGSNFIGAANYLTELKQWFRSHDTTTELANYATNHHIAWHFNPPLSPHMGGIWEAGVKSVKGHLYKVIGQQVLTYEEISTLFYKIEAILNSRPLCPLSASPEENDYLSPGHFLVGGPIVTVPQPSLLDLKENLLDRWQLVQQLGQRFWKRWHAEYLTTLQQRPKWMRQNPNIQVGDIVLLKEDCSPLSWPLAKVIAVRPGEDGVVRVATIRTAKATYQRPVVKLIPLLPIPAPEPPSTNQSQS